jgi:hypothetical protein
MSVLYDGKKLIPVPTCSIVKNIVKANDGEHINYVYNITVNGVLLPFKGSPKADGTFHTGAGYPLDDTVTDDKELTNLVAKQTAMSDAFSVEGKTFEIQPWDGGPAIKCNPRVNSLNFENGQWLTTTNYTLEMEAPHVFYEGAFGSGYMDVPTIANYNVRSIQDSWNIELNEEEQFWTIRRDLSATGDRVFDENGVLLVEPWYEARRWCLDQATNGVLPQFAAHVDPLTSGLMGFIGYNYARVTSPNKKDGTFSLSESWVATSGNRAYIESFEVSRNSNNEDGLDNVTINGEIRGLDFTTGSIFEASGKMTSANLAFSGIWDYYTGNDITFIRAKQYGEMPDLNQKPKSEVVTKREKQGVINYQREYDNRPPNFITGSLVERIEIADDIPHGIYPIITIPGRPAALIQDIGANTMGVRTINITVVMDRRKEPYASILAAIRAGSKNISQIPRPNVSGLATLFQPIGNEKYHWVLTDNRDNFDPQRIRLQKTYVYTGSTI